MLTCEYIPHSYKYIAYSHSTCVLYAILWLATFYQYSRHGHSTQDVLVSLVDDWREASGDHILDGTIFMDLSKAFDMVDNSILRSYPNTVLVVRR